MAKAITDRQAKAIKPGCKPVAGGVTGLTLQPSSRAGRGKWNLRFVSPETGKRRDMGLGVYPDVPVADALEKAKEARQAIAAGRDPIGERERRAAVPTFEEAARFRWEQLVPSFRNAKHRAQWFSSLAHVLPAIGAIRVDALTPQHFADALEPIWLQIPETASRVKQRCADVMATCWAQGHVKGNPLDVVDRLLPKQSAPVDQHQPAMPWRDVPAFVSAHLVRAPIIGAHAALLFAILTAARSGEVRGATWAEIDFTERLWTVPAERMKAHRAHRVPLSDEAVKLLEAQKAARTPPAAALVFPSMKGTPLSDMALTSILRSAHAKSDTPGRVATAHGFRASFKNWATDCGFDGETSERALAHTIANKVRAAYERTTQLEARRAMMNQWAAHVMGQAANVVPLRGKRRA
ncbi:MAG: site-specific integrase [Burkholderiaceae bacterium]|nr:MAG: site-specific integrase [Burkholderiaceae bacterium]